MSLYSNRVAPPNTKLAWMNCSWSSAIRVCGVAGRCGSEPTEKVTERDKISSMETFPKSFFQIGRLTVNLNAIAFIHKLANGGLRITTTVTKKDGVPASFLIPAGAHAEEFEKQLSPYIAVRASDIAVEGMPD
jgi:hypothetical protein